MSSEMKTQRKGSAEPKPFKLEDKSFGASGSGLQPPFSDDDWGALRRWTYEDGRVGGDGPTEEWLAATWDEKLKII